MAVTTTVFTKALNSLGAKKVDWTADTLKVMLVTGTALSPTGTELTTWQNKSDVTVTEATGTGYTAGGAALTTPALANTSKGCQFKASGTTTWSSSTISATGAIVYSDTATNKNLLVYINFGGTVSTTNGNFVITWDSTNGVFSLTAS